MSRKKPKLIKRAVSFRKHERWKTRPVFKGYFVPYTQLFDDNGTPNFQAVDQSKILECVVEKKCGVCGQSFLREKWIAFIGGEKCTENFAFTDPGMHPECAYYAAETCPYLKNEDGAYSKSPNLKGPEGSTIILLDAMDKSDGRPKKMMILFTKGYQVRMQGNTMLIIAKRDPHIIDWEAMPESK